VLPPGHPFPPARFRWSLVPFFVCFSPYLPPFQISLPPFPFFCFPSFLPATPFSLLEIFPFAGSDVLAPFRRFFDDRKYLSPFSFALFAASAPLFLLAVMAPWTIFTLMRSLDAAACSDFPPLFFALPNLFFLTFSGLVAASLFFSFSLFLCPRDLQC